MSASLRPWMLDRFARLLLLVGRREQALAVWRRVTAEDPAHADAWRSLGFQLAGQGRDAEAIEAIATALRLEPGDPSTRFNYAYLLHQAGRREQAIPEFERVVAESPANDRAWYGLGLCRMETGDTASALPALQEAAKLQYFNPHAAYALAMAHHRLGHQDALRAEHERVKGFDPKMAEQIRRDAGL